MTIAGGKTRSFIESLLTQNKLIRLVGWTSLGYLFTQIIRFGTSVILTRILAPEMFGVMILVMSLRIGLELFTDIGISQNIIVSKSGNEPDYYNTAWTLQVIRGLLLALLLLVMMLVITSFYDQEEVQALLPYVSLFFVITGFQSISLPLSIKALQNGRVATLEVVGAGGGSAIIILCAALSPTVMGLLVGNLLATAFTVLCSYFLIMRVKHRLTLKRGFVLEIVGLGKWIFLMSVLYFLATNFDRLILAKYVTFAALGIYGLAKSLGDVIAQLSTKLGSMVIFPGVASANLAADELRAKLARRRWQFLALTGAGVALLVSGSDLIISILYDNRYREAALILPWVGLATWVGILCTLNENVLLGMGKPTYLAGASAAKLIGLVALLPYGVMHHGVIGAAIATVVAECLRYAVSSVGKQRLHVGFNGQDLAATAFLIVLIIASREVAHLLHLTGPLETIFTVSHRLV